MVEEEKRNCNCNNMQPINNMNCNCACNQEPINERNCAREEMMMNIRELDFAIIELSLYLDTHPDDQKALCLHRKYCKELRDLKDKYQRMYGPLNIYYPCNKWRWLEQPWPWERGNY